MSDNPLRGREREAAERERAAGYFDAPRGIADLPDMPLPYVPKPRRWLTVENVMAYVGMLFAAHALGEFIAGWLG